MKQQIRLIFTGGGSGGHTMPAVSMIETIAKHCSKKDIPYDILYIGSENGIEKKVAAKNNIEYRAISTGKLRRYFSIDNFFDIFKVIGGFFQSLKIISDFKPDLIFSTGGFVLVPPVVAGRLLGKKIIIHEQTIDAGLANKISGKFADKVALTFKESKSHFPSRKTLLTGIPLRNGIFSGEKKNAQISLKLDNKKPVIYFSGGGLGCHLLNKTAEKIIPELLDKTNIIFQTGNANDGKDYLEMLKFRESLEQEKKERFIIYNFINDEIGDIFAVSDMAVARSGAGTVNELMALGLPAIFIPLAIATNNEQYKNAELMVKTGGAMIIEEKDLSPETLLKKINKVLFTDKLKIMQQKLKKQTGIRGNEKLLNLIISEIRQESGKSSH